MTVDGHCQAIEELRRSRARLAKPEDIRAYTELSWGLAFHLLAIGSDRRYSTHRGDHQGLGRQGNGHTAAIIDELLEKIEAWALGEGSH